LFAGRDRRLACCSARRRRPGCRVASLTQAGLSLPPHMALRGASTIPAARMRTVSLPIEILRTKPELVFWLATIAQALLWLLVPTLFYSAPPGGLADVLAVGRELSF